MSRILRHVGANDLKRTRQRQIGEQKERAAQKLKEWQEAEAERKQIEKAARPYKSNWRRENLREFGEWAPIETSGPANSTSTTFGYFAGGSPVINGETGQQVTFTYSGLNGVENYPTSVTIDQGFGDTFQTAPPPFSQIGVQGYTAKLNPRYAEAQKKYKKEYAEWEKQRDENFQKIKDTLKSFGTSFEELRASKKWVKKLGDGTFVALMPTAGNADVMNWTDNVRVVKLKQAANADPMYIDYNTKQIDPLTGKKHSWMAHNVEIQNDVYLGVGERPKPPMEQEYLMPRRTYFTDVNPQLDASQEFAQKVGADTIMNARVESLSPRILPKQDAVLATLQYAFGLYDPKKKRKGGQTKELEKAMLNTIGNSIRRGDTSGRVDATQDYQGEVENIPAQALLNNYGYSITDEGIVVDDRFNFDDVLGTRIGGAFDELGPILQPVAQATATGLVALGDRVSKNIMGIDPRDDARAGFSVQYTIPWSRVPANHPAQKLRKKKRGKLSEKWKYDWRKSFDEKPEKEVVVEVQEPKINKILKVNREKGGVVSDEFIQRVVSEGMTTSGIFQTTLNPKGDVDLVPTTDNVVSDNFTTNLNWSASNGVATSADDPSRIIPGATSTVWRRADMKIPIPADKNISTVKITVSKGGGTLNWTDRDPSQNFDADLYLSVSGGTYQSISSVESGVYTFTVDPKGSPYAPGYVFVNFGQFAKINATGQSTVQVSFQRRTPVNVFVSLDTPEATAFIRTDPIMRGLSAAERYKKLEDLLDAGDEYALKALGMQTSGTRPADTGNVKSWDQAANEVDYGTDLTPLSDNPYGTELGQIAMAGDMDMGGLGLLGMGAEALAAVATLGVAGLMATYNMSKEMATWLVNKYSASPGQAERDAQDYERGTSEQQRQETAAADKQLQDAKAEVEAANASGDPERIERAEERFKKAIANRTRVKKKWKINRQHQKNSYEPVGEVLTEKKKLKSPKDLQNKIPGYYDGKPAPLGFPMEPPAKMVNGFHADLVTPEGQEKQSNRYNRMDQATAKAMPMTDNPYINKKILKARKQPK